MLAGIQTVNAVEPIPNADAIERVRVFGWWVVGKRGEYRPGDRVVYCEIDSPLPERPEFEFLRASSFEPAHTDPVPATPRRPGSPRTPPSAAFPSGVEKDRSS